MVLLSTVLAYAVYQYGGVMRWDRNIYLLALALLALAYWLFTSKSNRAPALDRSIRWSAVLLPCYAAFQLGPLPGSVLRILSPARAELLESLRALMPGVSFAPLSVYPSGTRIQFLLIGGYTVIFLLVREIGWRLSHRPWIVALPIVAIGALEAVIGLTQAALGAPEGAVRGTYVNRNHYAGLLEMVLPFAIMYPVTIVRRLDFRQSILVRPPLEASGLFAVAALIFVGLVYSLSRMGFIACLCSLLVIGALAAGKGLPGRKRWVAVGSIAVVVSLSVVFLPPDQLIARFSSISTSEEISSQDRFQLWGETLHLVAAYPLFGCGLGGYESAFLKYKVTVPLVADKFAHNDYLQFLAELGLVGFAIAAALMFSILSRAVKATSEHFDADARGLAVACIGAFTAIAIHSTADFNLHIPANCMLLAWISGIAASLAFSRRNGSASGHRTAPKVLELKQAGRFA